MRTEPSGLNIAKVRMDRVHQYRNSNVPDLSNLNLERTIPLLSCRP